MAGDDRYNPWVSRAEYEAVVAERDALRTPKGVCPICDKPAKGGICDDEDFDKILVCEECGRQIADFYGRARAKREAERLREALTAYGCHRNGGALSVDKW